MQSLTLKTFLRLFDILTLNDQKQAKQLIDEKVKIYKVHMEYNSYYFYATDIEQVIEHISKQQGPISIREELTRNCFSITHRFIELRSYKYGSVHNYTFKSCLACDSTENCDCNHTGITIETLDETLWYNLFYELFDLQSYIKWETINPSWDAL